VGASLSLFGLLCLLCTGFFQLADAELKEFIYCHLAATCLFGLFVHGYQAAPLLPALTSAAGA
jgi:hypothetical protein